MRFHMTFEDLVKLFYFMTFIPKLHILATRCQKSGFLPFLAHFGHFGGLPYWKGKKSIKLKSCASWIPIWNLASVFSFSVRKGFKITDEDIWKLRARLSFLCFRACMCVLGNSLVRGRRPICNYPEGLVRIRGHLAEPQSDEKT